MTLYFVNGIYYIPDLKLLAFPITITTTPSIIWNLGNANHFKLFQPLNYWFQLEMLTPLLFHPYPAPPPPYPAIRILNIDFPELSPNSDDII